MQIIMVYVSKIIMVNTNFILSILMAQVPCAIIVELFTKVLFDEIKSLFFKNQNF